MDIVKECDEMLQDSELLFSWMDRLPDFIDKLPENDKKKFTTVLEIVDNFGKQDDQIHELKLAATYLHNEGRDIADRLEEVKKELACSQRSVKQLEQELKKPIKKQPKMESNIRNGFDDTIVGEIPESTVTLTSVDKNTTGQARKSRRRSVSVSAVKVVKKAVAYVRRSVSHSRKPPTLFD